MSSASAAAWGCMGGSQSTSISKAGWGKSDGKAAEEALVELAFSMWLNAIRSWNAEATTMVSSICISSIGMHTPVET